MERARWLHIEDVFNRALDVPAAEREVWLDGACNGDEALRTEVGQLLVSVADTRISLHDVVAVEADHVARLTTAAAVGRRLGPYRLRALLGEGGMGAVYLADRDDAQFAKQVAIKILPRALGSPQAVARFRDERQILAALEHENIVRLLDGGTDEDLPYLVMEHIEGKPITAYAREHGLSVRARVELVRDVCGALQYAHQNLIVHRDIKPSNILIDASGTAKLLDFGIAKLLSPTPGIEREARTRTGHALFTPEYASPEQARGEAVTTATDVYSVGAVLYELVAGTPPHALGDSLIDNLRVICEVDPPRPGTGGDLDTIILKALQKDPARRYASIEQLSDDLGRFLDGLPVHARVATLSYRVRKFVGRNRAAVAAVTVVACALVAAALISVAQARRADRAAAEAVAEKASAVTAAQRAQDEAERARRAEAEVQAQLEKLEAEQTARAAAESTARQKGDEAAMTREQLRGALDTARAEARAAVDEGRKAREAEARAEAAAKAERTIRLEAEALYQREKARRESAERKSKEITTTLR